MFDTPQNPLWNSDGRKPPPNLRTSHTNGKILNQPTLLLVLVTLAVLANAAQAVDYQEEWEEKEADVSQILIFQFEGDFLSSDLKVVITERHDGLLIVGTEGRALEVESVDLLNIHYTVWIYPLPRCLHKTSTSASG